MGKSHPGYYLSMNERVREGRGPGPVMRERVTEQVDASGIGVAQKYAIAGVGIFFLSFVPGAIANRVDGFLWLVPFADVFVSLGFVLSLTGAVLVGSTLRHVLPLGVTFGVGIFYHLEPHSTHIMSGIGLGLDHMTHIFLGLALIGVATAAATVLTFILRRSRVPA